MHLLIVRHAEAVERSETVPDEWRCLTVKGRKDAAQVAKAIAEAGHKPRLIITSPLTRAVQTAEIAARFARRKHSVEVHPALAPNGQVAEVAAYVRGLSDAGRIMIVGHEPQLGELTAHLLGRDTPVELKKGGCVALKLAGETEPAVFLWYLAPDKKRVVTLKKAFRGP
jgi:phosphohistidine phosphatase